MSMKADRVLYNIGHLVTPRPHVAPVRGEAMDDIIEYHYAFIAIKDGYILDFGKGDGDDYIGPATLVDNIEGKLVTPGLIDAHTHVVHYGSREHEFEQKMRGKDYMEILKEGGGILSSVSMTQQASEHALYKQSLKSLDIMLEHGTTTVEGKSGYGLFAESELKQLRVSKKLNDVHPVDIVPTFLGAHALPSGYEDRRDAFLSHVIDTMDTIKEESLAEFVDVFCETGVFSVKESERVLRAAKDKGFEVKIHADEIEALGGVQLAASLDAASADHLMAIDSSGMDALRSVRTVATVLPSTSFNLNKAYAPARKMINEGLAVAISSDYNPGSSPSENLLFSLNLAAIHLKLSPAQILNAVTINAAHSIRRGHRIGAIAMNYQADITVYDAPNWPYVLYHFAVNHVSDVYKRGNRVVYQSNIQRK